MRERPPSPPTATYSITGTVAQARLVPLLEEMKEIVWHPAAAAAAATTTTTDTQPHQPLHFVWETHLPRHLKHDHDRAQVRNRLANSSILEEKGHLARLMAQTPLPRLETHILHAKEVQGWLDDRRHKQKEEWWILKATGGNGAMDIHLLPPSHPQVPPSLHFHPEQPYVMQQYLTNPVLYEGKYKFHFRVYALLRIAKARIRQDGHDSSPDCSYVWEPRLYHHAYILRSSLPYDQSNQEDDLIHLTNLSLHKKATSYPGQIPVDLPRAFPEVYAQMKKTWAALIKAAAPFMRVQTSANHFEFFGLDFLLAKTGSSPLEEQQVYLLEVNRLPGLQSSWQNFAQEETFYNEMMRGLLRLCVCPSLVARSVGGLGGAQEEEEEGGGWERVMADAKEDREEDLNVELDPEGKGLYKNILKFGLYVKRNTL